jgi:predicted transcriptional regulator
MAHRVLTAHVPQALAREVDALAEQFDRPRGWIMNEALTLYVELERERHQLTLEALAEVDAGSTVAHEEIETWAASLKKSRRSRKR